MKNFFDLRESTVKSADRKPEKYTKPDGKVGVRMVPVDKEVMKTESKEIDEISLTHLTKKIADSGGMKQVAKANKADKLKKDLEAMKKRMATEQMDDEDDDMECPHCDMEDGEHEKDCPMMQEKTLTPAEKKKREEIAKAMERENPGMDMSKKMAIATAAAKRVAEEVKLNEAFGQGQQVNRKNIEASMRKALKDKGNYKGGKVLWNFIDADVYMDIKPGRGQVSSFYKLFDLVADKLSKEMNLSESVELDEAAPKMKGDWLKKERERNREHDAAMGRTPTGRKKPVRQMTSTQKSLAKMRGEEVELDESFASNMNKAAKKAHADAAEKIKKMGPVTRDTLADINAKLGNTTKKEEVELDEVLDTPKAMDSYRNKAKYSKERAANSAAAKMLRNPKGFHSTDTSDELNTMDKRTKGLKMADKAAARKTRAMMMKKEEVELDEGIEKMSHSRLKWHMNTGVPHGSYSKDEMKAERDRRMQHRDSADAYKKAKPSMSEEAKPDAVEVMRKKQQMANISTSDKDKLSKIRAMLNKEKKK